MIKQFILILLTSILISTFIVLTHHSNVEAQKYKTYDGESINKKEYDKRLLTCYTMVYEGLIQQNTDCDNWVLTYVGESLIAEYVLKKALTENKDLSLSDLIN